MKKALKLEIRRYIDGKLVNKTEKLICAYCQGSFVYNVIKKKAVYCRECGKLSGVD